MIDTNVKQWKTKQSVVEQQGKKEKKNVYKYIAACNKIKQQYEDVYKLLGVIRGQRIKPEKFVKLQNVKSSCDVLEQRIKQGKSGQNNKLSQRYGNTKKYRTKNTTENIK